jgi:transposase-like protein
MGWCKSCANAGFAFFRFDFAKIIFGPVIFGIIKGTAADRSLLRWRPLLSMDQRLCRKQADARPAPEFETTNRSRMKTKVETWPEQDSPMAIFSGMEGAVDAPQLRGDGIPRPYRPEGKVHIRYPKELKLHVTLEALRERVPQSEIGATYGVPQSLVSIWKKAAVETIRGNIHYKQRKRREALGLMEDPAQEEELLPPASAEAVQQLCSILRGAARQLERDPAALEQLIKRELGD